MSRPEAMTATGPSRRGCSIVELIALGTAIAPLAPKIRGAPPRRGSSSRWIAKLKRSRGFRPVRAMLCFGSELPWTASSGRKSSACCVS
jgi:hypothetical protein